MKYTLINPINKNYSPVTQVLTNRGIQLDKLEEFFNPTEEHLHDEYLLDNIEEAAKCILKHVVLRKRMHIQVDSDCDGYTSAAVLINYLYDFFPSYVQNYLTYSFHEIKGHGIQDVPEDAELVIAPDGSSNENDIHKELAEKGVQVVVLDHHHAENDVTDPAIIVNNQMCEYPNKALSGVGIVYKTCLAMDKILSAKCATQYLDLVALGLTADMMDTKELETRFLILEGFQQVRNPFFYHMCEKNSFSMKNKVTQHSVAWYIAPYINAVTRIGTLEEKTLIFKSMLTCEAFKKIPSTKRGCKGQEELLVEQAVRTCGNIKNHQDDMKNDYIARIKENHTYDGSPVWIILLEEGNYHRGLTGLVANQLMGEYKIPTLVLHQVIDENGEVTYQGSGRGYNTGIVSDWRKFCGDNGAFLAEGHPYAFGAGFTEAGLRQFQSKLGELFTDQNADIHYDVDFVWKSHEDFDSAIQELATVGDNIWGQGVAEPYVVIEKIPVSLSNIRLMGKGTVRIDVPGHKTNCIKFNAEPIYDAITARLGNDSGMNIDVSICGRCQINEWNGTITPQIHITDYEIVGAPKWDF